MDISSDEKALGFVLGIAAGVLVDSAIFVTAGYSLVWFLIPTLGAPVVVAPWIGAALGVGAARRGRLPELRREAIVLIAVIALPLCVFGPFFAAKWYLNLNCLRDSPVYPGARLVQREIVTIPNEGNGACVIQRYATAANPEEIRTFYRNELSQRGWSEVRVPDPLLGKVFAFGKETRFRNPSLELEFEPARQDKTEFAITYFP
jgi:hypothetical protein